MLKSLSVAAILLAASLANASADFDSKAYDLDSDGKPVIADETQFAAVPAYVKASKSKKSEETSASDAEDVKYKSVSTFKSKHKKWLKDSGKAKSHVVTLKRQKPTHKDGKKLSKKEKKKAKKSKKAVVNNTLDVKTKDAPVKISVISQDGVKKGVNVYDNGEKLFKTTKKAYAVVEPGKHSFSLESNHSKTSNASVMVEKLKAKKIAGKFYVVTSPVSFEDAQDVCEMFGGNLANLSDKNVKKITEKAEKFIAKDITNVWIEQHTGEKDSTPSVIPQILSLKTGEVTVDPEELFVKQIKTYTAQAAELKASKEAKKISSKKYKKALKKIQKKTRKEMDKVKITNATHQYPVLCKL